MGARCRAPRRPGPRPKLSPRSSRARKEETEVVKGRPVARAPGAPWALPRKAAGGPCSAPAPPRLPAGAIRRLRAGRGCSQHRPEGPGPGQREACARGGGTVRRPGRSGPSALPGPGHDPRCSLLQARRRGPQSPAAAATTCAREGPVRPGRGSAVSPPGSGECPPPRAPGCLDRDAQPTPLHPFHKKVLFPRPQLGSAASTPRKLQRREGRAPGRGGGPRGGRGPSRARASPQLLADFSAETQVWGKLGPLWPCCNLHPAGRGVSLRVGPLAPHSPPDTLRCHEFLGKGADRHSSKLERSPAGVGAGGIERNHFPSIEYLKIYYL